MLLFRANFLQLAGITLTFGGGVAVESKGLTDEIFDGNESPDYKAAALDMVHGIIVALAAMTILALVVPMYRVVHGFPCGDDLRLLCNWILPLVALVMITGLAARLRNKATANDGSYTSLLPKVAWPR